MMCFILTIVLISLNPSHTAPYESHHVWQDCHATFAGGDLTDVTYNLCPLLLTEDTQPTSYSVQDSRYDNNDGYIYKFNIGASIPSLAIPSICTNQSIVPGYCIQNSNCKDNDNIIDITDNVWAYQILEDINNNPISCYPLSNKFGGPPQFSLINLADPTQGIRLQLLNGDYAPDCGKNRMFDIEFICENNANFIPTKHAIYETSPCEYTLRIFSIYGCPIECDRYDNEICGNNGICGYDFMSSKPKCFCYYGFGGNNCMDKIEHNSLYQTTKTLPKEDIDAGFTYTFTIEETNSVVIDYNIIDFKIDEGIYIIHNRNKQYQVFYIGLIPLILPKYDSNSVLPESCNNITMSCINIDEITGNCLQFKNEQDVTWGFAFMVDYTDQNNEQCIALSLMSVPQWELYDKENPTRGVTIVYSNGSYCSDAGKNREYRSHLVCPMDQEIQFNRAEQVRVNLYEYIYNDDEYDCSYSTILETAVACPYQCITQIDDTNQNIKEFSVCSTHGICAADKYAGFVRCLCDDGYNNDFYCRNQTYLPTKLPTISPTQLPSNDNKMDNNNNKNTISNAGIVVTIVILVLVVLLLCVLCGICLRKLTLQNKILQTKIDDQEYTKFAGDDDHNTTQNDINTIVADDGTRGFATIPVTVAAADDDDDDGSDDQSN